MSETKNEFKIEKTIKKATRQAYGETLVELGKSNKNIVVLEADLSTATKTDLFKKEFPDRFFDCGIAEGNMMGIAAGLSTTGLIPFASTFAMFAAGRAYEQIRNSIGYPHLNVKIGASHAGLSVGEDGGSHQCCEDIALMNVIPGMTIFNPCDCHETIKAVEAASKIDGPCYIRLCRLAVESVNDNADYDFFPGKGILLKEGSDITIIATGLMVQMALKAADILQEKGISARVVNIHTIKPIDKEIIIKAAKETGGIVTAEEHSVVGGLGSIVASVLAQNCPTKLKMVGVNDVFGRSGTPSSLFEMYGLTPQHIIDEAISILK